MDSFELRLADADLYNIVTVEAAPRAPEQDGCHLGAGRSTARAAERHGDNCGFDAAAYAISGVQFEAADDGGNSQTANVTVTPTYYAQRRPGGRQ